jgi:hypothetical protein
MKITKSVRRLYDEQLELNQRLEVRVKELFEGSKPAAWFFRGRIKPLESFAQKLETGRGGDPSALEDFYACTLVVENRTSIGEARAFVERFCEIIRQKPEVPGQTHKRPDSFQFDDLRLYVRLRALRPDEPIAGVLFEVQIKTFLQHAWGIATRDLIYKGDQISWGKARVAYQVKAMLEHAEVSIAEVNAYANSEALALNDDDTRKRNHVLDWLRNRWSPEQLPEDRRRLVDMILQISRGLQLSVDDIIAVVERDTGEGSGINLRNLSPYGIVLHAIFTYRRNAVHRFLRDRSPRQKLRLFLTEEMELGDLPGDAHPERFVYVDAESHGRSTSSNQRIDMGEAAEASAPVEAAGVAETASEQDGQ